MLQRTLIHLDQTSFKNSGTFWNCLECHTPRGWLLYVTSLTLFAFISLKNPIFYARILAFQFSSSRDLRQYSAAGKEEVYADKQSMVFGGWCRWDVGGQAVGHTTEVQQEATSETLATSGAPRASKSTADPDRQLAARFADSTEEIKDQSLSRAAYHLSQVPCLSLAPWSQSFETQTGSLTAGGV